MLLSAREMGLGDDHAGIVELPADAPVGVAYAALGRAGRSGDRDRRHAQPRRLASRARRRARPGRGRARHAEALAAAPACRGVRRRTALGRSSAPEACPWILGRTIRGLRNCPSPQWLADRLTSIGLRPINALVDVTNFFTFDLGRPLHVFDVDKMTGDALDAAARCRRNVSCAERQGLHASTPEDCAIADAAGVQSIAGVIGGEATGCDETTTAVFIECALFDPVRVALTGRRHQIVSDARQRFERGIDPALMPDAVEAATAHDPGILRRRSQRRRHRGRRRARLAAQRHAAVRAHREVLAAPTCRPDEAVASLERLGFTVRQPRRRRASPSPCRPGATTSPAADRRSIRHQRSIRAAARAGRRRLRRDRAGMRPDRGGAAPARPRRGAARLVAAPGTGAARHPDAAPDRAPHWPAARWPRRAWRSASPSASWRRAGGAVRRGARQPAAEQSDRRRSGPVAAHAGRDAGAGGAAQRRARLADMALFESGRRSCRRRGSALSPPGCAPDATPRNWAVAGAAGGCAGREGRLHSALLAALGVPREALSVTADAPGFYHPGRSGVVRQGPKTVLARSASCIRACWRRSSCPGRRWRSSSSSTRSPSPKRRRAASPDLPAFQPVRRDFAFLVGRRRPGRCRAAGRARGGSRR